MARADDVPTTSRRRFLSFLGIGAATATASVAVVATNQKSEVEELPGHYERPLEYFLDMQAIGWRPVAMFCRRKDGSIYSMGVEEKGPGVEGTRNTWRKYHAISMRCPAQLSADVSRGHWWDEVWQFLYDRGLREDVTPPSKAVLLTHVVGG